MPRFLGLGNGSDGVIDLSSYTPLSYSCSGSSGSYSLTATGSFSAGQRLFIIQSRGSGVGEYEDNQVVSYSPGTVSLLFPLEHTYTDSGASQAQVIIVKQASGVNGSITVPAWNGDVGGVFVMACNGIFNGSVNASGKGYRGGARGLVSTSYWGAQGEGSVGFGTTGTTSSNGNGGGGSYTRNTPDSEGQGAGGGGNGTAGQNGNYYIEYINFGLGGSIVGQADLTTGIFMGGGGGGGGGFDDTAASTGPGQPGGGIIVVYTNSFSSSASLITNGVDGNSSDGDQGGGGAGAGGSVLIKARSAIIGSSKITANGGARGAEGSWGGAGGVGRIRIEACSLSGTTNPSASTAIGGHNYCGVLAGMI
ncbi:MAG: hypothetical protein BWY19_01168 [bacterium ADurb.Bin212]|nr:MAG: hypothetical protein BWY19_01168 [bacterium ADurb.Bin212]